MWERCVSHLLWVDLRHVWTLSDGQTSSHARKRFLNLIRKLAISQCKVKCNKLQQIVSGIFLSQNDINLMLEILTPRTDVVIES